MSWSLKNKTVTRWRWYIKDSGVEEKDNQSQDIDRLSLIDGYEVEIDPREHLESRYISLRTPSQRRRFREGWMWTILILFCVSVVFTLGLTAFAFFVDYRITFSEDVLIAAPYDRIITTEIVGRLITATVVEVSLAASGIVSWAFFSLRVE